MKKLIAGFLAAAGLMIGSALPALAVCTQKTNGLRLCIPNYGDDGDVWGTDLQNALTVINSSVPVSSTYTAQNLDSLWVRRIGGNYNSGGVMISSQTTVENSSVTFRQAGGALGFVGSTAATPFSVGTSTFVVKGGGNVGIGAAVPNSLLHISSGGITIDGSGAAFRLNASPSNGYVLTSDGNGVGTWQAAATGIAATSSSTWSGYNQFVGSTTIGTQIFTTTVTEVSVMHGGEALVAYSSFTAVGGITISNFQSTSTYRVDIEFLCGAAACSLRGVVSSLTNTHAYINNCNGSAVGAGGTSGESQTSWVLNGTDSINNNGVEPNHYTATIRTGNPTVRLSGWGVMTYSSNGAPQSAFCIGKFNAIATVTFPMSITWYSTTGNLTGRIWVYKRSLSQAY